MLSIRGLNAFEDNYIWLAGRPGSRRVVVVDPGDADPVLACLEHEGLTLEAILVTHRHGDHTGGIRELLAVHPARVFGPAHEPVPGLTHPVHEGEELLLADGLRFRVLETPGHTRGHVCYYGEGVLFCGDTLFAAGCGRLFEGTPQQMNASLERIAGLPPETMIYCAHEYTEANLRFAQVAEPGNTDTRERARDVAERRARGEATVPSPLALELRTNPFLRSRVPALVHAAEEWAGRPLPDPASVFGAVRAWKDSLD